MLTSEFEENKNDDPGIVDMNKFKNIGNALYELPVAIGNAVDKALIVSFLALPVGIGLFFYGLSLFK